MQFLDGTSEFHSLSAEAKRKTEGHVVLLLTPESTQTHLQKKQNLCWSNMVQRPDPTLTPHTSTPLCSKQTVQGKGKANFKTR